jgi:hypothetical protein
MLVVGVRPTDYSQREGAQTFRVTRQIAAARANARHDVDGWFLHCIRGRYRAVALAFAWCRERSGADSMQPSKTSQRARRRAQALAREYQSACHATQPGGVEQVEPSPVSKPLCVLGCTPCRCMQPWHCQCQCQWQALQRPSRACSVSQASRPDYPGCCLTSLPRQLSLQQSLACSGLQRVSHAGLT